MINPFDGMTPDELRKLAMPAILKRIADDDQLIARVESESKTISRDTAVEVVETIKQFKSGSEAEKRIADLVQYAWAIMFRRHEVKSDS